MIIAPIYNRVIVPHSRVYFQTEQFKRLTGVTPEAGERAVLILLKEETNWEDLRAADFYELGVTGSITDISDSGYLVIKTEDRVRISDINVKGPYKLELKISKVPDVDDLDRSDELRRLEKLKVALDEFVGQFAWGAFAKNYLGQLNSLGEVATAMSIWIPNTADEKYAVLAEDSTAKRADIMEDMVYEYLEIAKLNNEATSAQKEENEKVYRKQAIQKQMEYLQKELDEMDPESVSDVRKFELAIDSAGMNPDAEKEARKVLNRLKQEGKNSPESGMLYDYLDFVTSLSWKKEQPHNIDLTDAEKVLDQDHYGLKKIKNRILQQIAVMDLQHKQSGSILLFVGAPGTGKTSIGRSIADALQRKYVRVSLGGVRDEADIRGHRRTYIGAMPGRIMDGIQKAGVSNPVMVLDEVDKLGVSYNGDPSSALLEVLDPEQNDTFTDHYMNVPYDLSDVLFICTANTVDTIPEPLLNRMEVIEIPGYTATEKFQIARRHLLPRAMEQMGIAAPAEAPAQPVQTAAAEQTGQPEQPAASEAPAQTAQPAAPGTTESPVQSAVQSTDSSDFVTEAPEAVTVATPAAEAAAECKLEITDDALRTIISDYTAEAGVRGLKKRLDTLCRAAAVELVRGDHKKVTVTPDRLREMLDIRPITHDHILAEKKPGIVTGLAWTRAGGEILFIETLFTKGTGKLIITGQLGDVMKESAQIAVSLVKSMFPDKAELFEKNDLHLHVPEGAVPKDGPSAGITLTTAIASLVTGRAVSPEFAMTGEVSLRGVVTAIGGLPEKLMAAQRAGISTVFIPKDNEDDLKDVAEEVREKLNIIPVSDVSDVLLRTGIIDDAQELAG